ncbi:MAG TPA: hypothetical protein VFA63_19640, partial [Pseudonocardiaceae bacterium]|nr:hypothetical protein [Pseudonocardiaceae bacterium]
MNDVPVSSTTIAAPLLVGQHTSLMHGWLPVTIQALTAVVLVLAVGRRSRRWWMLRLPVAVVVGLAVAVGVRWFIDTAGLADDPAPLTLWLWV